MGRSVLSYQFVAGLRQEIKVRLAGVEGTFEQLLARARLEEAKLRDLAEQEPRISRKPINPHIADTERGKKESEHMSNRDQFSRGGPRCYHCCGQGHIARNCPVKGRAAPFESQGRGGRHRESNRATTMNSLVAEPTPESETAKSKSDRVRELRAALQEAELEESFETTTTTMHGVELDEKEETTLLGATITAEVVIEGTTVEAMIDTGSPVTIVSLDFLLQALAKQRAAGQSPEEWEASVRSRLVLPQLTLKSYGGGRLNIVRQMKATISRAEHSATTTIFIQKNAPCDLLIGTDLLGALGFHLVVVDGTETKDLLSGAEVNLSTPKPMPTQVNTDNMRERPSEDNIAELPFSEAEVRLVTAVSLPARHEKLVRADVDGFSGDVTGLFESAANCLKEKGVTIEDAAAQPDTQSQITLIVRNNSLQSVVLEEGQLLGSL